MRLAGRWMTLVPLAAFVLISAWNLIPLLFHSPSLHVSYGLFETVLLALPGGCMWLGGWILEGFAKNNQASR